MHKKFFDVHHQQGRSKEKLSLVHYTFCVSTNVCGKESCSRVTPICEGFLILSMYAQENVVYIVTRRAEFVF